METPVLLYEIESVIYKCKDKAYKKKMGMYECSCGNNFISEVYCIKKGKIKSCGCSYNKAKGLSNKEGVYSTWEGIKQRCYNPNAYAYKHYGGKGIKICDRWLGDKKGEGFLNFLEDMGDKPSKKHSIDRIDVNGNYEPNNCRWATQKEQNNNRNDNVIIEYNGIRKNIQQWAESIGITPNTIQYRIKKGWLIEDIVTKSAQKKGWKTKIK